MRNYPIVASKRKINPFIRSPKRCFSLHNNLNAYQLNFYSAPRSNNTNNTTTTNNSLNNEKSLHVFLNDVLTETYLTESSRQEIKMILREDTDVKVNKKYLLDLEDDIFKNDTFAKKKFESDVNCWFLY
jgi:hypothetical protein